MGNVLHVDGMGEVNLINVNTLGEGHANWERLGGHLAGGLPQTQGLSKTGVS